MIAEWRMMMIILFKGAFISSTQEEGKGLECVRKFGVNPATSCLLSSSSSSPFSLKSKYFNIFIIIIFSIPIRFTCQLFKNFHHHLSRLYLLWKMCIHPLEVEKLFLCFLEWSQEIPSLIASEDLFLIEFLSTIMNSLHGGGGWKNYVKWKSNYYTFFNVIAGDQQRPKLQNFIAWNLHRVEFAHTKITCYCVWIFAIPPSFINKSLSNKFFMLANSEWDDGMK